MASESLPPSLRARRMALARRGGAGQAALVALAGVAGGGAPWALQAAQDPVVHEVAAQAGAAVAEAGAAATAWLNDHASLESRGGDLCFHYWESCLIVALFALIGMAVAAAAGCCCGLLGCACGGGCARHSVQPAAGAPARGQQLPRHPQARSLEELADFLRLG
eukprot:9048613-Pyramimonas_sp.AAC.1